MSKATKASCILAVLALALVVSGCTADSPRPSPSATSSAQTGTWPAIELHGQGPHHKTVPIPSEARSLHVRFVCTAGVFLIHLNSGLENDRGGSCGGTRSYRLPLPDHEKMILTVGVPADTTFSLTARFSGKRFVPASDTASACTTISAVETLLQRADDDYAANGSQPAWKQTVGTATDKLRTLSTTAPGLIREQLPAIVAWITGPAVAPGTLLKHQPLNAFDAAYDLIAQVCRDNGTPVSIHATNGG